MGHAAMFAHGVVTFGVRTLMSNTLSEEQARSCYCHYLEHTLGCDPNRAPYPSMCEEMPDGFELRSLDQVFAFVTFSGEVIPGDEYVIDHPDRQVI